MPRTPIVPTVLLAALAALPCLAQEPAPPVPLPAPIRADTDSAVACLGCVRKRPLLAAAEVLGINVIVNRVDAWVGGQDWAYVGPDDWSRNLRLGWEWDENEFQTNMFSHPYHGALYFNAGRSNGLGYWESAPLAFLGSFTWEYFGEKYRPSLNDFYMTSFGGITLGEVFHRVGASIRDNTSGGRSRTLREIAALPFDPVGGVNRLLRGEWSRRFPNPVEHDHGAFLFRLGLGYRAIADTGAVDTVYSSGTILADLNYGDRWSRPYRSPFDVFSVRAQVSPAGGGLNALAASGRLFGVDITKRSGRHRQQFEINQRYDYANNPAYKFGAQSVEAGLASRWQLRGDFGLRTDFFGDLVFLGGVDAPYTGVGERTYDFGPGAGFRVDLALERRNVTYLRLVGRTEFIHSVSGAEADHLVSFGGLEGNIHIARRLGVGLHALYYDRKSRYADGTENRREFPEVRVLGIWTTSEPPRPTAAPPRRPPLSPEERAARKNPHRQGLWLEMGSGPSRLRVSCTLCEVTVGNVTGGYLRMGGVISRKVLMGVEVAGVTNEAFGFARGDTSIVANVSSVLGTVLWYPMRQHFFIKGGVGLANGEFTLHPTPTDSVVVQGNGVGLTFGLGWDVPVSRKIAFTANLAAFINAVGDIILPAQTADDVIPTFYQLSVGLTFR